MSACKAERVTEHWLLLPAAAAAAAATAAPCHQLALLYRVRCISLGFSLACSSLLVLELGEHVLNALNGKPFAWAVSKP